MLRFDSAELLRELDKLPVRARAAFAAACAERLLSAFEGHDKMATLGDFGSLSEAMAHLWAHISGDARCDKSLNEDLALSLSLVPDEQDALDQGQPYAGDAVAAIIYAIKTSLNGSSQDAVWAGQRAYDAVDHAVVSRLNTSLIGKDEEAAVIADAMVQSELERQQVDLAELKIAALNNTDLSAAVMRLQARAKADAQALFSSTARP
jgi:Protein of unknown function (DUF416)